MECVETMQRNVIWRRHWLHGWLVCEAQECEKKGSRSQWCGDSSLLTVIIIPACPILHFGYWQVQTNISRSVVTVSTAKNFIVCPVVGARQC